MNHLGRSLNNTGWTQSSSKAQIYLINMLERLDAMACDLVGFEILVVDIFPLFNAEGCTSCRLSCNIYRMIK